MLNAMTDHSITPPQYKVSSWWEEACKRPPSSFYEKLDYVAAKAAQLGADQEREACVEWLRQFKPQGDVLSARLRAARRPKPKSRKQRALDALTQIEDQCLSAELAAEIRNALEGLPDD